MISKNNCYCPAVGVMSQFADIQMLVQKFQGVEKTVRYVLKYQKGSRRDFPAPYLVVFKS